MTRLPLRAAAQSPRAPARRSRRWTWYRPWCEALEEGVVTELVPAGYVETWPIAGYYTVPLAAGAAVTGEDFANVVAGTPGKITGGGSVDERIRNFGFIAQGKLQNGVLSFSGNLEFQDKDRGLNLHSTAITLERVEPDGVHGRSTARAAMTASR